MHIYVYVLVSFCSPMYANCCFFGFDCSLCYGLFYILIWLSTVFYWSVNCLAFGLYFISCDMAYHKVSIHAVKSEQSKKLAFSLHAEAFVLTFGFGRWQRMMLLMGLMFNLWNKVWNPRLITMWSTFYNHLCYTITGMTT